MEPFTKIFRPGEVVIGDYARSLYVKAGWDGKRLSMTGVEGPMRNGAAAGACGQIVMHPWDMHGYAPGWTPDMVAKLRDVWGRWHMNDTRPYDAAMRADGWHETAQVAAFGHEFTLTTEAMKDKKAAEEAALAALRNGQTFTPSREQAAAASRPYKVTIWTFSSRRPTLASTAGYEPARHHSGDVKLPERKTLGWLKPSEHPDGLLTKVHPKSGNGYGCKWYHEDVPEDVLQWLKGLPDTDLTPAWV